MKPDYEIADVLELTTPEQFKALGDSLRQKILSLLGEHAATTIQLAETLKTPTSTVAHHLRVLLDAELIKVVQTRQVRAITEKYYGCTARTYMSISNNTNNTEPYVMQLLQQALREAASALKENAFQTSTIGHARISTTQARTFSERVRQLIKEFESASASGEPLYSFVTAIYRTELPELPVQEKENE